MKSAPHLHLVASVPPLPTLPMPTADDPQDAGILEAVRQIDVLRAYVDRLPTGPLRGPNSFEPVHEAAWEMLFDRQEFVALTAAHTRQGIAAKLRLVLNFEDGGNHIRTAPLIETCLVALERMP